MSSLHLYNADTRAPHTHLHSLADNAVRTSRHTTRTRDPATPTADPARRARRRWQLQDALQQDAEAEGAELQGEGQREREVAVRLQEVEEAREGRRRGQGVEAAVGRRGKGRTDRGRDASGAGQPRQGRGARHGQVPCGRRVRSAGPTTRQSRGGCRGWSGQLDDPDH